MQKLLFLDYREVEVARGFAREPQPARKHRANPLLRADQPWENGNMQLYGSVVKDPGGPFRLWYSTVAAPWCIRVGYAESDDGLTWRRPPLDVLSYQGQATNAVIAADAHGIAVIRDAADPDPQRRYKMVAGTGDSHCVHVLCSPDGRRWQALTREPQIPHHPDCPMAFYREADGRYVVHHRVRRWGRRICRNESFDLLHWASEPRMVLEPGPADPPQTQFYGMGAALYGPYVLGTLWVFHTDAAEMGRGHMNGYQDAELAYARSGHAWHRLAPGQAFLPHGGGRAWDRGNVQCASQPVFLDDEIRYYYAGTDMRHRTHWELQPQKAGLGLACLRPDGFVALRATRPAELLTVAFAPQGEHLFANAAIEPQGQLAVGLLDAEGRPLPGYELARCEPLHGDALAHAVRWGSRTSVPLSRPLRLRVRAAGARLFSLYLVGAQEQPCYHQFSALA